MICARKRFCVAYNLEYIIAKRIIYVFLSVVPLGTSFKLYLHKLYVSSNIKLGFSLVLFTFFCVDLFGFKREK